MAFPSVTYTDNGAAAAGLTNVAKAAGLDLSGLNPQAQIQSAVANLIAGAGSPAFTGALTSTTAIATPAALAATGFTAFASTVSGAAIMGFGTTNDVSLMNRAGTVAIGIVANTTSVTLLAPAAGATQQVIIDGTGYGAGVASLRFNGLTTAAINNQAGTLLNAPTAGNPTFWLPVSVAGAIRYCPLWS